MALQGWAMLPQLSLTASLRAAVFKQHREKVREATKADKDSWVWQLAEKADEADIMGDFKALYDVTRSMRAPKGCRPHSRVLDEAGVVLVEHQQIHQRWCRHWASLFAGSQTSLEELARHPPEVPRVEGPPPVHNRDKGSCRVGIVACPQGTRAG